MLILFRVWEQRRELFIYFLLIISPVRCCAPVMRTRLKGKARQMDGPGHTAIFFRLDCLIRSLAAPSARTNCFTSNCGPMRDDLSWRGCWRRAGFVRSAADDGSPAGRAQSSSTMRTDGSFTYFQITDSYLCWLSLHLSVHDAR